MRRGVDTAFCLALFLASITYLYYWPHDLGQFDEGLFLYEAKRILSGDVMYRDFFEIVTPISFYGMALLFGVFGVTIETARVSMAVVHGLIAVLMYTVCRELKIRPGIAVATATLQVAVFYPALRFASPHWISTFLTLVVLFLLLREKVTRLGRSAALGALAAVLIWTQQQKGLYVAAAVGIVIVLDHVLDERGKASSRWPLAAAVGAYIVGLSAVSAPILVASLVWVGFRPVYDALVLVPLNNYRGYVEHIPWGFMFLTPTADAGVRILLAATVPLLMRSLPLVVMPLAALRIVWQWATGRELNQYRPLLVTTVVAASTLVSVLYNPDITHLAIVGPIWSILVAEGLDTVFRRGELWVAGMRIVRYTLVAGLLLGLGRRAYRNMMRQHSAYPVSYRTAFGRVHFGSAGEFLLVRQLARLGAETPTHEIFVYPCAASLYLLTDTVNPTRFQFLLPTYHSTSHYDEVLTALEQRKPLFIARNICYGVGLKDDPLFPYVQKHYVPLARPYKSSSISAFVIYQRNEDADRKTEDGRR